MPVVSQIMMLVFKIHARWLAWSTEHHINHYAFPENEEDEELEHDSRTNMPMFLLKHYALTDLMAMILGRQSKTPSFLVKKKGGSEDEKDDLPVHDELTKLRIGHDIAVDRMTTNEMLARRDTDSTEDAQVFLQKQASLNRRGTSTYGVATEAARLRQMTRKFTLQGNTSTEHTEPTVDAKHKDNNTYNSATTMARLRQLNRANTLVRMEKDNQQEIQKRSTVRYLGRANTFRRSFKDQENGNEGETQKTS
jgi:hypothetical protein